MLYHVVCFKMNDGVAPSELVDRLRRLRGTIPGLESLEAGESVSGADSQWEVGLLTTFADAAALEAYRVHPAHQEVVAWIKENTRERTFIDYLA